MKYGRKILLGVAMFLFTLELLLQVGAIIVSVTTEAPVVASGPSVVCLGDSYTAGVGATSPEKSYPSQLQRRLHALGHDDVEVVNGGCPGKDSAFMMRRLPSLLQAETKVLCILMAFNDTWSRPDRVDLSEIIGDDSNRGIFEWRWRTGRLIALCARFASNSWYRTSEDVEAADTPPAEPVDERSLVDLEAGFGLLEVLGVIGVGEPPPAFALYAPEPLRQRVNEVEQLAVANKAREALEKAEALVDAHKASPQAHKALAVAAHFAGKFEQSQRCLAALAEMAASGDPASNENHIAALLATEHVEQSLSAARAYIEKVPRSLVAWIVRQDAAFRLGEFDEFRAVAPQALRVIGRLLPPQSASVARHYAGVIKQQDGEKASKLMVAATLIDGSRAMTRARVPVLRSAVPWRLLAEVIDQVPLADEENRGVLRDVFRAAYDDDGSDAPWAETMQQHMLEIGAICAERGIKLVVLNYPFPNPELQRIQRLVAERLGAPFVSLLQRFDAELKTRKREELFVSNGHCTDAGYEIVAELVSQVVDPLLPK